MTSGDVDGDGEGVDRWWWKVYDSSDNYGRRWAAVEVVMEGVGSG